jgi:hypothetical protein
VNTGSAVSASDTASASDSASVTVLITATDNATAADLAALAAAVAAADLATALNAATATTFVPDPNPITLTLSESGNRATVGSSARATATSPRTRGTAVGTLPHATLAERSSTTVREQH